ncbi:hypothetical protein B4135_2190 [Caldibacillus debilis]|uniref:Uncharacterized protein n=1 Tax=Caldibacillus debilis TaxID=301148 RepID=A0A150M4G5_9BACI|nr:hypothetical protein B4135_2190 [Caldibacillus debilis]
MPGSFKKHRSGLPGNRTGNAPSRGRETPREKSFDAVTVALKEHRRSLFSF